MVRVHQRIRDSRNASWTDVAATAVLAVGLTVATLGCGGGSKQSPAAPSTSSTASPETVVLFDQGHFNLHTLTGTYAAFAQLLRGDGWILTTITRFDATTLQSGRILVIANALAAANANPNNWTLPTPPAFSPPEIAAVRDWVQAGGALLLIADHMPFAGAAEALAAAFGARFVNSFTFDARQLTQPVTCLAEHEVHVFRQADGSLAAHPITAGIEAVATFTGSAFESDGQPLMVFGPTAVSLLPQTAWAFTEATPRMSAAGWRQGAVTQVGRGRVAFFGEAAMFSEQTCGPGLPMGMNSPLARDNRRFVLNVINWLAGRLG